MVSEEERTKTAREAPREDMLEDHDDRESEHIQEPRTGTSNHHSDDKFCHNVLTASQTNTLTKSFVV